VSARLKTAPRARVCRALLAAALALWLIGPTASPAIGAIVTKSGAAAGGSAAGSTGATPEGANGGAFSELSGGAEQEATQTQTTETTGTSGSSTSNSKKTVLIIVIAAIALLVAIGYVIVRDARGAAPAGDPQLAEARSAPDSAAALRRRRAKAKAARRQRKRNR
jgi:hypothetical protein